MSKELTIDLLALLSTIIVFFGSFSNSKKRITMWYTLSNVFDIAMYIVAGAKTGIAGIFASICKSIAFAKFDGKISVVLFMLFKVALLIMGYEGIITILFIVIQIVGTASMLLGTTSMFRVTNLASQIVYVAYDFYFATPFVALLSFVAAVGMLLSIIKPGRKDSKL